MPPKKKAASAPKGRAKGSAGEEEFDQLLKQLSKATQQVGKERAKTSEREANQRREREERHKAAMEAVEKAGSSDLEELLRSQQQRQRELKLQEMLNQLLLSSSPYLRKPNTTIKSHVESSNPHFDVAVADMQGWRSAMEDAYAICLPFPVGSKGTAEGLFCVFDGHAGKQCAAACSSLLPQIMCELCTGDGDSHTIPFDEVYCRADEKLKAMISDNSGCTAVSVHVTPTRVTCASVGDSRAVLCRNKEAFALANDHKPENDEEKERITNAGGFVQDNRVNGQLAMSRALGDYDYKKKSHLSVSQQEVIPNPSVISTERKPEDRYVVLACDGIFDVLSNSELIEFINEKKAEGLNNEMVCRAVCNRCLAPPNESGTGPSTAMGTDNMTIMIVDLK